MSLLYKCDACDGIFADGVQRLELSVVAEPQQIVEADEGDLPHMQLAEIAFGFNADHHFCGMGCLSSWAMGRAIDAANTA